MCFIDVKWKKTQTETIYVSNEALLLGNFPPPTKKSHDITLSFPTCMYSQVHFKVMGGAEGLATVGAVFHGGSHTPLSVLGSRRRNCSRCLRHLIPDIWERRRERKREEKHRERCNSVSIQFHFKPATCHSAFLPLVHFFPIFRSLFSLFAAQIC